MIPIGYEGRHTSFQILDSVIGSFDFVVDPSEMERLSSCAAILGSKYTSQHSVPCLVRLYSIFKFLIVFNFISHLQKSLPLLRVVDWSQLMLMEGEMLIQIDFRVYPQVTAVSFAPKLLDVLEMDPCIRSMILNTVERLIAEFVEGKCLRFYVALFNFMRQMWSSFCTPPPPSLLLQLSMPSTEPRSPALTG